MSQTIASLCTGCSELFEQLHSSLYYRSCQNRSNLRPEDVGDQIARFKLLAGNLGAFHRPQSNASIEHRLREAPKVATQLIELLNTLSTSIQSTFDIALGKKSNRQADTEESFAELSLDDDLDSLSPEMLLLSEAEELFELAKFTITSLFRIAIMIRNSTSRDRFAKASLSSYTQSDSTFEIKHVREKFPLLTNAKKDWLNTRLGVANSQRRGYLSYVRDHQRKLEIMPPEISVGNDEGETSTMHLTTASTFLDPTTTAMEPHFDDNLSEASSALSSLGSRDENYTRPPSLANVSNGSIEFECPLCRLIQRNLTERTWQKHLYEDLRPYVCTFEDCDLKLFPDPASWMAHESAYHRSRRQCPLCTEEESFDTSQLRTHIQLHLPGATKDQIETLIEAASPVEHAYLTSDCPFCDSWEAKLRHSRHEAVSNGPVQVTSTQYKKHVGSHMRQLALFVIPREYMQLDEDPNAHSQTNVDDNDHSESERSSLASSADQIHKKTLSSSAQHGDREISDRLNHESAPGRITFRCPVRVRELDRGVSEFSCPESTYTTLAEVRRHMKHARHVSFLELCPTCQNHVVDKTGFETYHGQNCNNPQLTAIGPKAREKQWQQLYDSINPNIMNEATSQTTPFTTGRDPSRGTIPDADTEANMEEAWIKHMSDAPVQLHDERPENSPSLNPTTKVSSDQAKEAPSTPTHGRGVSFIFRIDEIQQRPDIEPIYDKYGIWNPSINRGDSERVHGSGATGIWWFCNGQSIQDLHVNAPPPGSSNFQTFSLYYSSGFGFWVLHGDATSPPAAEAWHPLSFEWDDQDYSSYLTNAGTEHTLRVQRNDQTWPAMLLPATNQLPPVQVHPGYGGLKGDLSLFLGLIAFPMDRKYLVQIMPQLFVNGAFATHRVSHGRQDQRGVVVYVYTCPSSWGGCTAKDLERYQDGKYGKYYP